MTGTLERLLDQLAQINIDCCCITTYDLGVANSVKRHLINTLAQAHGIEYQLEPRHTVDPPEKGERTNKK